jgi:hypothetical protein
VAKSQSVQRVPAVVAGRRSARLIGPLVLGVALPLALLCLVGSVRLGGARAQGPDGEPVYYVDAGGGCGGETPCYTSIQDAVDHVDAADDLIKVAAGTYTGVSARGSLTQVVYISRSLTIRGGYATTRWTTSFPVTQPTTLDAEGQGRVVFITGAGVNVTLEGLRIAGGDATGLDGPWAIRPGSGGGICVGSATLTLVDSWVYSNTTPEFGGGVFLYESVGSNLTGNEICSNTALYGGGVDLHFSDDAEMRDNGVFNNHVTNFAGGISLRASDGAKLAGNLVRQNSADYGIGGMSVGYSSQIELTANQIYDNDGNTRGGGVSIVSSDHVTMANNIFAGNQVAEGGRGAAVLCTQNSQALLLHTTLACNRGGQGVYSEDGSTVHMTNTVLVSHTIGVEASTDSLLTMVGTLWGSGAWANLTDTVGSRVSTAAPDLQGDPAFAAPAGWDYHLTAGSAAIDSAVPAGVITDLDGDRRPDCCLPDLGADEYMTGLPCNRGYVPLLLRAY